MEERHSIYGSVPKSVFYAMLHEARVENLCTNEEGRTDIGELISHLITEFSKGKFRDSLVKPLRDASEMTGSVDGVDSTSSCITLINSCHDEVFMTEAGKSTLKP